MSDYKKGDRLLIAGTYATDYGRGLHAVHFGGPSIGVSERDIRPYTDPDAAHPLDAAIAELGRVTGLAGDDLLTAAKRAILSAARRVRSNGFDVRVAREEAMHDIRRVIGDVMPSVLEHAAALPPPELDDDESPF